MTHDGASLPLLYKDVIYLFLLISCSRAAAAATEGRQTRRRLSAAGRKGGREEGRKERWQRRTGNHGNAALLSVILRPRLRLDEYVHEPHGSHSAPA